MSKWSTYVQGFVAALIALLIALVSLSWSEKPSNPTWIGEDRDTAFIFCALERPKEPLRDGDYRLTRAPALFGSLNTVTLSLYPEPNLQTTVYDDQSFSTRIIKQERNWLSELEYKQFVQAIADTGILQSMPSTESAVVDGIWFGFEHHFSKGSLSFGSNDMRIIGSLVSAFDKGCGNICKEASQLADDTKRSGDFDLIYSSCPPIMHFDSTRTSL